MRKYLAIGALLTLSICAFGSPEPDRPNLDQPVLVDHQTAFETSGAVFVISDQSSFETQTLVLTGQEAVYSDFDLADISYVILPEPITLKMDLTDLVIEEDKHKARDRYILPIWDYLPIAEPPSRLS